MNDYERVARLIRYLDEHQSEQPDLAVLAAQAGLSRFHLHRLFSRWAGITPKDFLQCLTLEHARALLRGGRSVLDAAIGSGLSGPGRLHDLAVALEAATPGEIKSGGAGWTIRVGYAQSPFGLCLIGETPRGVCHLSFHDGADRDLSELHREWPAAQVARDDREAARIASRIFTPASRPSTVRAFVRGTEFQVRVWRALLRVPSGGVTSYGQLASAMGQPTAARAVGSAVGANAISFLIPCHRVIRETGISGNYRWGPLRKRAMLAWETA
ncbi:MAG: methylated-DNA--[protein]-cysteine S-methyltransferase [Chthoniobacteraceae bacterium]